MLYKFASPGAKRVLSVTPLWQLAGEIVNKRGQREARTCAEHMLVEKLRLPQVYIHCSVSSPNAWAFACRQEHARAFVPGPSRWTALCAEARAV